MADNLTTQSSTPATVPSSTVIATDDVAGVHYQRVKLVDGTLDGTGAIGGDATNGLDVDVTRVQGTVTVGDGGGTISVDDGGGSLTVDGTVAVSGTVSVDDGGGSITVDATSLPLPTGAATAAKQPALGTAGTPSADVISIQGVASGTVVPVSDGGGNLSIDDGGNSITVDGTVSVTGSTVTLVPATSGGLTAYRRNAVGTSGDAVNIKASAGQVYGWYITNTNASPRYVKLYNSASAPTAGSGTPVMVIMVPGNSSGAGVVAAEFSNGIAFSSGIGLTMVTGTADSSSTSVTADEVIVNLFYK